MTVSLHIQTNLQNLLTGSTTVPNVENNVRKSSTSPIFGEIKSYNYVTVSLCLMFPFRVAGVPNMWSLLDVVDLLEAYPGPLHIITNMNIDNSCSFVRVVWILSGHGTRLKRSELDCFVRTRSFWCSNSLSWATQMISYESGNTRWPTRARLSIQSKESTEYTSRLTVIDTHVFSLHWCLSILRVPARNITKSHVMSSDRLRAEITNSS